MNVLVFGATGASGHELVCQALARGHRVTAFVRTPSKLRFPSIAVILAHGDVGDAAAVARALDGQTAVLSALGAASPLRRDPVLVEGVRHIVRSMEQTRVRRLVYLSFLGVPEGRAQLSLLGRTLVSRLLLRKVVADHVLKEEIIRGSGLDWILVRPPRLTTGPRRGVYRHGANIRATSFVPTISRADLADFMLRQLEDDTYVRQAPAVMY
jgi:putative NADH-flavin reductase